MTKAKSTLKDIKSPFPKIFIVEKEGKKNSNNFFSY
jgi:hypothetical protein